MALTLKPGEPLFDLLKNDLLAFFEAMGRNHGDQVEVRVGSRVLHLIQDPALIREIFFDKAARFGKAGQLNLLGNLLGQGLLTSDGSLHQTQRRILQPHFHPKAMGAYMRDIRRIARQRVVSAWPLDGEIEITDEMNALTLQVLGQTMFGAEFAPLGPRFKELFDLLMKIYHRNAFSEEELEILREISPEEKLAEFREFLDDLIRRLIEERRNGGEAAADFLSLCDAGKMSQEQFRDETVTLLFAGHETTSVALSWTLRLLSLHPEPRRRMIAEIRALPSEDLEMSHLRQLPFLMAVIKESMRLYPPVWNITRKVLEPVRIGSADMKPDELVFISPFLLHRDQRHFAEPARFLPERWLGAEEPAVYFPFGAGARRCIGEHLALLEAAVILIEIFRLRDVAVGSGGDVRALGLTTLKPHPGVRLRIHSPA